MKKGLTPDQVEAIVAGKQVIYDGFKAAVVDPAVRDCAGILEHVPRGRRVGPLADRR